MVNARHSLHNQTSPSAMPRRTRQAERGAAVFIVVMVLTLLTAVGLFAVRSASLADLAAGYDREGAQAALVAEYAVTASAAYLANDPTTVLRSFELSKGEANPTQCQSNAIPAGTFPGPAPRPGCYRLRLDEVQNSFRRTTGETVFALPNLVGGPTGSTSSSRSNAGPPSQSDATAFAEDLNPALPSSVSTWKSRSIPLRGSFPFATKAFLSPGDIASLRSFARSTRPFWKWW